MMRINHDTSDFLEPMLFGYNWEDSEYKESDVSIYDIDPEQVDKITGFIASFNDYLLDNHEDVHSQLDSLDRSFGGNIYFSLSGHGVGFFDDRTLDSLQGILEKFAGNRYLFEELDLYKDGDCYTIEGLNL